MTHERSKLDEDQRLVALEFYNLVDAPHEPARHDIVDLAAQFFQVPIASFSILFRDRQIYRYGTGITVSDVPKEDALCSIVATSGRPLVVLDAASDPDFADNPFVTGGPRIRFYAGVPLQAPSGQVIGTFCIVDREPRAVFSDRDRANLSNIAALMMDQLELRRLNDGHQGSRLRFENIAATSSDAIVITRMGRIRFWNAAASRLLGYGRDEVLGRLAYFLYPERLHRGEEDFTLKLVPTLVGQTVELQLRRKDAVEIVVQVSVASWVENGEVCFGSILRDISEQRAAEAKLHRLAHFDALTGLANRTMLRSRLAEALATGSGLTVMALDLDGFKEVNDIHGHSVGDLILKATAGRIQGCVDATDTVARMGGDEFVLLLPGLGDPLRAAEIADRLIEALSRPFLIDDQSIVLGASVGIAIAPAHGRDKDELLTYADLALYQAKEDGRHCHRFFTHERRHAAMQRRTVRQEISRAVAEHEFELFYQPQVNLSDGSLIGAEALIRWRHPHKGLLAPAAFIAELEGSRHAADVGHWVIETACAQAARWRDRASPDFRVGVNLSTAHFRGDGLADRIEATLGRLSLPPSALEVEITENIILKHDTALVDPLRALRDLGVGIAFDDYGTGYASLSLLTRFPLTRLKIDQSFVGRIDRAGEAAVVRAVLYLGNRLGLAVIAEGIETQDQLAKLKIKGCEEGQGYLFGRPMPAATFETAFFAAGQPARRASPVAA